MYCDQCGKELPNNALFCAECGKKVRYSTELQTEKGAENSKVVDENVSEQNSREGLSILCRIISIILWILCCWKFIYVFDACDGKFNSWYRTYEEYGSISPISKLVFYGVVLGMVGFGVIGVIAALSKKKSLDSWAILGNIVMILVLLAMEAVTDSLENHFMDTAETYMMSMATRIYVENIEKTIYLYLGLNILMIKLKTSFR